MTDPGEIMKDANNKMDPNSAAGQARVFYYGTDEVGMTIKSQDFDQVYHLSGKSGSLKGLVESSEVRQSA